MVNSNIRAREYKSARETRDLIPRFGCTKNPTSRGSDSQRILRPFLTQVVTKRDLKLLTIIKMGNTKFPWLTIQSDSSRSNSNHLGAKHQE
jgi:hypothetical protein